MTGPAAVLPRLGAAAVLGAALGVGYEALRPLRLRAGAAADLSFLLLTAAALTRLSFGVCGGDLRLGHLLGLLAGLAGASRAASACFGPVFSAFWCKFFHFTRVLTENFKKVFRFSKKMFASAEKWVTIKCNKRRRPRRVSGGAQHGKRKDPPA